MKRGIKKVLLINLVIILLLVSSVSAVTIKSEKKEIASVIKNKNDSEYQLFGNNIQDYEPNGNLEVTVTIKEIRALDKIKRLSNPNFFVKLTINEEVFTSKIWKNQKYISENWSKTVDVPDNEENVSINIQLWDYNNFINRQCDLVINSQREINKKDVDLIYSVKTGHWRGDDYINHEPAFFDFSGYGRLNGCDDNTIYDKDMDCEIFFDITQTDTDGDNIPYWAEKYVYNTDPMIDDTGLDADNDNVPIEWEHKWGHFFYYDYNYSSHKYKIKHGWKYDPFKAENHSEIDLDKDGLNNVEEYLTSQWGSDPFRKDIFVEVDVMEEGPNGEKTYFPEGANDLLKDAFHKWNIVFHMDTGNMGGGEFTPFDNVGDNTTWDELRWYYDNYFMHNNESNWRRGVFHYACIIYNITINAPGNAFSGDGKGTNSFQLSSKKLEERKVYPKQDWRRNVVYASVFMHELGHTLGIFGDRPPGCDDFYGKYPWQFKWWLYRPYRSTMNYGYTYYLVYYSDGSRGKRDYDDWHNIDLQFFQREWEQPS